MFQRFLENCTKTTFWVYWKILSPFLCGYRNGFNPQTVLLGLVEKWKALLFKKGYARAILMDLPKAFEEFLGNNVELS